MKTKMISNYIKQKQDFGSKVRHCAVGMEVWNSIWRALVLLVKTSSSCAETWSTLKTTQPMPIRSFQFC